MAELLRTRCTAGFLVITDQAIRIERKGILGAGGRLDVLPRQAIVGVKLENKVMPVFGKGGGSTLIFNGQGNAFIRADMVNAADARHVMELLGFA
jgi:hypothetical protein